ncbi:MAG: UTP--glucose-1-phosphate uridylyltransferase GalU [Dehalococcoidia bacterium]|nr:UTP--glucose-1-phosphate uridylyltransferase GalU [Dehalococcoidia bacterium]
MTVQKAVIPAAGLGTRFLPATKATPKEMIPLVDKPGIQYVVEEAVRAGITDILIIVGRGKRTVEDHFDRLPELEDALIRSGKQEMADEVRRIAEVANVHFVRQGEPRGLGHAIGVARHHIGDEPFAVLLPDDLMDESATVLADMVSAYGRTSSSVIALKEFPPSEISAYGVVNPAGAPDEHGLVRLAGMVEKPPADKAPSSLAIMGRYLFTPEIFECIDRVEPGKGGEIQITDAMVLLLDKQPIYGLPFTDGRYDTGNKLDWLRATVELGLRHPEMGEGFREALAEICRRENIC